MCCLHTEDEGGVAVVVVVVVVVTWFMGQKILYYAVCTPTLQI
jgi:hypothetical protein